MEPNKGLTKHASSTGRYFNTGNGPTTQFIDIGHSDYVALLDPDTAFWSLLKKDKIAEALDDSSALMQELHKKRAVFPKKWRFSGSSQAVRCLLQSHGTVQSELSYCYIPEDMRPKRRRDVSGTASPGPGILKEYFRVTVPEGRLPQIVFHGSEPCWLATMFSRDRAVQERLQFRGSDQWHALG